MNQFLFSGEARNDLHDIWDGIAADNEKAADKLIADLLNACAMLAEHPQMGGLHPEWTDRPLRFYIVSKNYWIVYACEKPLEVLRLIHAARDVPFVLRGGA